MFRCDKCHLLTSSGEPMTKVVVATREHHYPIRENAHKFRRNGSTVFRDDPGGIGQEIAKEYKLCPRCVTTQS